MGEGAPAQVGADEVGIIYGEINLIYPKSDFPCLSLTLPESGEGNLMVMADQ